VCRYQPQARGRKRRKLKRRKRMEGKRGVSLKNVGFILCGLGGAMAVLESGIVLAYTSGGAGLVGLLVAVFILAGTLVVHKGFELPGALIVFLSSLIGQLTGGTIGLALVAITSPPPSPIFNDKFVVSSWAIFSLIGSILILFAMWKRGER
jgi:drug/metabolite transporter (DMT)-like permease